MNRPRFFLLNSMVLVAVMAVSVRVCPGQVGALPVKFTVLPGVSTPVYLNVLPSAVCRLRETRATDDADDWEPDDAAGVAGDLALSGRFPRAEQNFLRVYSDADGNARFTVSPPARTSLIELNLKLRCRSNGVRQEYPIALRASDTATGDMPFPPANDPAVDQSNQTTLPALTGDALGLTNQTSE